MLCPYCQALAKEDAIVCPNCGQILPKPIEMTSGVQAIRQGRRARMAAAGLDQPKEPEKISPEQERQGVSRPASEPQAAAPAYGEAQKKEEVYFAEETEEERIERDSRTKAVYGDMESRPVRPEMQKPIRRKNQHPVTRHMINWTHVAIAGAILAVVLMVGVYIYLTRTAGGQRVMARLGRDASSAALWEVGEEKMNVGDIDGAIGMFLQAKEKDGEDNVNVSGVLMLGSAYEALGMMDEAEALYTMLYTDVVPSAPDAYTNTIHIMISEGRDAEAAALMQLAYTMTGSSSFYVQRREMLPAAPEVNITAGTYDTAKTLTLTSLDGVDVYYTFNEDAVLPTDGVLYTEPIYMDEGMWHLRAVAVNGELISDELKGNYRIVMPSPGTPECNLAPNTYQKRRSVKLRKNADNEKDDDIIIYYTIDGSLPDEDSPIYQGTAIQMPAGVVTLQAVAVNKYGKASNTFSRTFKFDVKPLPLKAYSVEDTANGIVLYTTTLEEFQAKYGTEQSAEPIELYGYSEPGVRYNYSWGYAAFIRERGVLHLIELYFTDALKGPRATEIGSSADAVIGKFRDMGQVASPSGNRGLYTTNNSSGNVIGFGKYYADLDGERLIRYTTTTPDSHLWRLDYILSKDNIVKAMHMVFTP